jgi:hypothetical protein
MERYFGDWNGQSAVEVASVASFLAYWRAANADVGFCATA